MMGWRGTVVRGPTGDTFITPLPSRTTALSPCLRQAPPRKSHRWTPTPTNLIRASSSSSDPEPADGTPSLSNSSSSSYPGPTSIAIPAGLRSAGAVFVLAGFLKILILCFPYSTMAISMFIQGRADLGVWAAAKMIPFAVGILALGKYLSNARLISKQWFAWAVAVGGIVALFLSRWAFARPRPSPLDPMLNAYHRQATSLAQEKEAKRRQQETVMRSRSGLQPPEEARKALQQRERR